MGITVHFVCWSRLLICQQYFYHFACESLCEIIACWLKFHFVPNETFHSFNGSSSIIHPPNAHKHTYTHTHAYIYMIDWICVHMYVCMCVYIYVSATIISLLNQSYPECLWWFKSPGHAWWRLLRHQPRRRRADACLEVGKKPTTIGKCRRSGDVPAQVGEVPAKLDLPAKIGDLSEKLEILPATMR